MTPLENSVAQFLVANGMGEQGHARLVSTASDEYQAMLKDALDAGVVHVRERQTPSLEDLFRFMAQPTADHTEDT